MVCMLTTRAEIPAAASASAASIASEAIHPVLINATSPPFRSRLARPITKGSPAPVRQGVGMRPSLT